MEESVRKRRHVIEAALEAVLRYGLRKTSMQDVADLAGISRTALYLQFENKEMIFRAVSTSLHEQALSRAESAFQEGGSLEACLSHGLCEYVDALMIPIQASPHGQELLDANKTLATDITADAKIRFLSLLETAFQNATARQEIMWDVPGTCPKALAELIYSALGGFKADANTLEQMHEKIALLSKVISVSLKYH